MFEASVDRSGPAAERERCLRDRPADLSQGWGAEFGPHRLRHTFAAGMLASGATLQEVQGLLRHAHLRTNAIDTKVDDGCPYGAHRPRPQIFTRAGGGGVYSAALWGESPPKTADQDP